jgi:hypothetical protein
MSAPLDPQARMAPRRAGARVDETAEAAHLTALRRATMDQRDALGEALAQAGSLLDELAERGRYARDVALVDREADRLCLALALMRARRGGFEDGVAIHAWWHAAVDENGKERRRTDRG